MAETLKRCRICGKEKPLSSFDRNWRMRDGHLNQCKPCRKPTKALWREDPESKRARRFKWRRANAEKHRAHTAVWRALGKGLIKKRSCEVCGSRKVQAHHDDYSRPLDINWLCQTHHMARHQLLKHGGTNETYTRTTPV